MIISIVTTSDDLDAVLQIEEASFTSPWTREMYLAELEHKGIAHCYLARDPAGEPLGFCSFWRILDEVHINNLAVLQDRRRRGVASALLGHVLSENARTGATRATLEVRRSNDLALALYDRFGFRTAGVRPGYYSNPVEDALILWRENLSSPDLATGRSLC